MVIALTHMRLPNDLRLAENVPGIDLVLGGVRTWASFRCSCSWFSCQHDRLQWVDQHGRLAWLAHRLRQLCAAAAPPLCQPNSI